MTNVILWLINWLPDYLTDWLTDWLIDFWTYYLSNFMTSELQNVRPNPRIWCKLTHTCASRRSVQFFDIGTSKSAPTQVFCTFSLRHVLLATVARNFWFLLWPHDSAPAACLLFDSPDTQIIEKTKPFATSLKFRVDESSFFWFRAIASSFFWLYFISSAFQISILSEVYYLNFLRQYF